MFRSPAELFRKAPLERLSSPERIDELMEVLPRPRWLTAFSLLLLVGFVSVWLMFGSLPERVEGRGLMIRPAAVRDIEASSTGIISSLVITQGQRVSAHQVIATIDQDMLSQRLSQQRAALEGYDLEQRALLELEASKTELQLSYIKRQRGNLKARIASRKALSSEALNQELALCDSSEALYKKQLDTARRLAETLNSKLDRERKLLTKDLALEDQVLATEVEWRRALTGVSEVETKIAELEPRRQAARRDYRESLDQIAGLSDDLARFDLEEEQARQRAKEREIKMAGERRKLQQDIEATLLEIEKRGPVRSPCAGRVIAVIPAIGSHVTEGQPFATVEEDGAGLVECVAFLTVADGRQARAGMSALVYPESVERERYGGIRAWVTEVAPYPVSAAAAARELGGANIAQLLLAGESLVRVRLSLVRSAASPSGYEWSSAGPPFPIDSGMVAGVSVNLDERAPVTYILPLLRSATGIK